MVGAMNSAKFFSQAFVARLARLVGLGRAMSALSWGTQPTPAEAGGTTGFRTALLGFSIVPDSRSKRVANPACFSFMVTHFEAALDLCRLQTLIFQRSE